MTMAIKTLLITPPFTQLNTPYPATLYLKGFIKSHGYEVFQSDLGIELINSIFSRAGFQDLFSSIHQTGRKLSSNSRHMIKNEEKYIQTIAPVMDFLQYRDNTLAQLLCNDTFLPKASRFAQMPDLEWTFGNMSVTDKARFLATLYIEDIGDLIKDAITPYFGFSRYAEKLGLSAHSFSPIAKALRQPENILEIRLQELLIRHVEQVRPDLLGMTIPFPGNLYAGLKCGQLIKKNYPHIKIVAGGGFVNTELRELSDPAIFDYLDFITLDDGERPFLSIVEFLQGRKKLNDLTRTFVRVNDNVRYINDNPEPDFHHTETGCPDYSDLHLDKYLSLIEMANPMHRLWSDGCWNKLTIARGCYWHKCAFCDTSLPYIERFESAPASLLVDRIEQVIVQTGHRGFHFVDEAAPPAVLKAMAEELIKRKIAISWWTNIRFENAFSSDLCRLLAVSGCIAVTGGLESASDRLLKLMNKGITVRQAASVCKNFVTAGIMVHAYLIYGFPSQTIQETVDALEIVRQFFDEGLIQSAFWHRFSATVHSGVGINPQKYSCTIKNRPSGGFARNDLAFMDHTGCNHDSFSPGLSKAVYNFMHGIGTDMPVHEWFDFSVPVPSVKRNYIKQAVKIH